MNELSARRAIKKLIVDAEAELVTELEFQGQPRSIHQVTYSSITPPTGYYFISVTVASSRSSSNVKFKTTSVPPSQAVYEIVIEISDYAITIPGEEEAFERMDGDFQIFTDRVVAKIRENYEIEDEVTSSVFVLNNDRMVTKSNIGMIWEEAAQYHAVLNTRLTLQLLEACTDDSNLY